MRSGAWLSSSYTTNDAEKPCLVLELEDGRAALRYRAFNLARNELSRLAGCRIHRIHGRRPRKCAGKDVKHLAEVLTVIDPQRVTYELRAGAMRGYRQRRVLAGRAFDELLGFGFPCHRNAAKEVNVKAFHVPCLPSGEIFLDCFRPGYG